MPPADPNPPAPHGPTTAGGVVLPSLVVDAFAAIRSRCLQLGLLEGSEFVVEGFPTSLGSEHLRLRRACRTIEVVHSDLGRRSVVARLATFDYARDVFVHEVAVLARGRGHGPLVDVRPVRVRWPEELEVQRAERVLREEQQRDVLLQDPEAVVHPHGWAEMRVLGDAVVAYLGHGTKPWPGQDADAAVAVLERGGLPATGIEAVRELVEEASAPPSAWGDAPLGEHGRAVAERMRLWHGGLSAEAGAALAWSFTYQWK